MLRPNSTTRRTPPAGTVILSRRAVAFSPALLAPALLTGCGLDLKKLTEPQPVHASVAPVPSG